MSAARSLRALSPSPRSIIFISPQTRVNVLKTPETGSKNSPSQVCLGFLSPNVYEGPKKLEFSLSPECKSQQNVAIHVSNNDSTKSDKNHDDYIEGPPDFITSLNSCLTPTLLKSCSKRLDCKVDDGQKLFSSPLYTPDKEKKFLGRGSFGSVILCKHKKHKFALKIVRKSSHNIGEKNFLTIRHPHLVHILKVSDFLDRILICMEFAGNCNLMQILANKTNITARKRISFALQVADGLNHCHKCGIVHGDVKTANVLVSPLGHCKLGDFGNSMKTDHIGGNSHGNHLKSNFRGTAAYAAPEVLRDKSLSTAADIYSLGITLWEIYTSEVPFSGQHPHIVIYKVAKQHKRPEFPIPKTKVSKFYIDIATSCWNLDAQARPSSSNVLSSIRNISHQQIDDSPSSRF